MEARGVEHECRSVDIACVTPSVGEVFLLLVFISLVGCFTLSIIMIFTVFEFIYVKR